MNAHIELFNYEAGFYSYSNLLKYTVIYCRRNGHWQISSTTGPQSVSERYGYRKAIFRLSKFRVFFDKHIQN